MRRIVAMIAFAGFFISLVVHGVTYLNINLSAQMPLIWLLHIGPFGLIGIMQLSGASRELAGDRSKRYLDRFFEPMPKWTRTIYNAFAAYAILNFALFFLSEIGQPVPVHLDGEYVLYRSDNGQRAFISRDEAWENDIIPKEIVSLNNVPTLKTAKHGMSIFVEVSEDEYHERETSTLRGFSGHWMIFYLFPALYFWFPRHKTQPYATEW